MARSLGNIMSRVFDARSLVDVGRGTASRPGPAQRTGPAPPFAKPGTPATNDPILRRQAYQGQAGRRYRESPGSGVVTHTISPLHPILSEVELDCGPDLKVTKVTRGSQQAQCTFGVKAAESSRSSSTRPYGPADTLDVAVEYSGKPVRGLYFVEPAAGYPEQDAVVLDPGRVRGYPVLASMLRLPE